MAATRKEKACKLFEQGFVPGDDKLKKLGLTRKTVHNYYRYWKNGQDAPEETDSNSEDMTEDSTESVQGGAENEPRKNGNGVSNIIKVIPKTTTITSNLLWQAKQAAEEVWGWPEYELGEFLDRYLYKSFAQRDVILGGYTVIKREENNNNGS